MKRTLISTAAIALLSTSAFAGGMAEPVEMAPVEIIEDTAGGTSQGLLVPLILIALIAAAASSSSDSVPTEAPIN